MAEIVCMAMGDVVMLVIWTGRAELVPTWMLPKLSVKGEKLKGDGLATPKREMNSSAVLESEVISRAEMRLEMVLGKMGCGVKLMLMTQLAEGTRAPRQLDWTVKSGMRWKPLMWMVVVPVLASVMDWVSLWSPTWVAGKVMELWERA
jgi:hypothetical protein